MKRVLLAIGLIGIIAACNNGGGGDPHEPCDCNEGTTTLASQTVQGDTNPCDEYRLTGECEHTRECEELRKNSGE